MMTRFLRYCCVVLGEDPARVMRWHYSSLARIKALAVALHLVVGLWLFSSFLFAHTVLDLAPSISSAVALVCASLIFALERIVIAARPSIKVMLARLVICVTAALPAANAIELIVAKKDVQIQLRKEETAKVQAGYAKELTGIDVRIEQRREDWLQAQRDAHCEAQGCKGQKAGSGPIWEVLDSHSTFMRDQYLAALAEHRSKAEEMTEALKAIEISDAMSKAGPLQRLRALYAAAREDSWVLFSWITFTCLLLAFELQVIFVKTSWGATVDDEIQEMQEQLSRYRASVCLKAKTARHSEIRALLRSAT